MTSIVVVNNIKDWNFNIENVEVVPAKTYLMNDKFAEARNIRVYNLCRSYRYQSIGYYVSLLAAARGHKVFPNISTIQDFKSQSIIRISSDELDQLIQRSLSKLRSANFEFNIYFGKPLVKQYERLSKHLHNSFPLPLFKVSFVYNKKWVLQNVAPITLAEIPDGDKPYAIQLAEEYFTKKQFRPFKKSSSIYDLAILVSPDSNVPPSSDPKAIKKFVHAAESIGLNTEIITKDDGSRIPEFDALFIRDTTAVNHYTYRFAQRAVADGLVAIDDPESIIKCTNKVYLAELMAKAKIPRPKTVIVHKDNRGIIADSLGFPCVLKQPDSNFSRGVVKVNSKEELQEKLDIFLNSSDLIIAQEFMPTDFDWRIGILDKKPLYACKYFMARGHWQIVNWVKRKSVSTKVEGGAEVFAIEEAPIKVVSTALRAANLVGDGFYGVDLKEKGGKIVVIEINDNPSVCFGDEDKVLKDELYLTIMQSIFDRIHKLKTKKK